MNILKYLIENYGSDEPIFSNDLRSELNINNSTLRQYLKRLVDKGQLKRYEKGIYYIPKTGSILKNKPLSFNKVVKKKYLYDGNKIIGYQSGITFANDLNLTTQTESVPELVTNKETNRKRKVKLNNRYVTLRKPRTGVTETNARILQVLDLMTDIERVSEKTLEVTLKTIKEYLGNISIEKEEFNQILNEYPMKTTVKIYESGLYDVIARK